MHHYNTGVFRDHDTRSFRHVRRSLVPVPVRRPHRRRQLRQGHRDLQVREDQAGQAARPSPPIPSASCSTSASAKTTTWPTRVVREALKREVDKLENRGYADNGIAAFKEAAAGFMKRQFGVTLDPVTEVNHAIGSKPALRHAAGRASSTPATSR